MEEVDTGGLENFVFDYLFQLLVQYIVTIFWEICQGLVANIDV